MKAEKDANQTPSLASSGLQEMLREMRAAWENHPFCEMSQLVERSGGRSSKSFEQRFSFGPLKYNVGVSGQVGCELSMSQDRRRLVLRSFVFKLGTSANILLLSNFWTVGNQFLLRHSVGKNQLCLARFSLLP